MASYSVRDSAIGKHATVTLACADSEIDATFAPSLGMIACSLRHRGAELLGQRDGLAKYAASGSTMGIPLLHPWANRLSGFAYTAAGRSVSIDPHSTLLHRDGNGLPMHGLLAASPRWQVVHRDATATSARLSARFDFAAEPALLALFPFPHILTLDVELRDARLTIVTALRAGQDVSVPVSFGFHPYLQLLNVARAEWHIEAPVRRHLLLDPTGIPTGASEAVFIEPGPLADRSFDDLYTDLRQPAEFVLAGGGRRITVQFDAGFPFAQIYAPNGKPFICFEPMTAPTNALVSGAGLPLAVPGSEYRAAFSIGVDDLR